MSLYQEFFTGKGSLSLELSCLEKREGECWELFEKKGKLHVRGESEKALIYALSFLKNISPLEIPAYIGKHAPCFPYRVLHVQEKIADYSHILQWGFNALIGEKEADIPLKFFKLHQAEAFKNRSRHELLKDLLVQELKEVESHDPECIFLTQKELKELNFETAHAILAFEGESNWDELKKSAPFGAKLMPYIRPEEVEKSLMRMKRHPFIGTIVRAETLGPHLYEAGYKQFSLS